MPNKRTLERFNCTQTKPDDTFDVSTLTYPRDRFDLVSVDHIDTWQHHAIGSFDKKRQKYYPYIQTRKSITITVKCKKCGSISQFQDSPTLTCRKGPCSFTWRDLRKEKFDTKILDYVYVSEGKKKAGWYWKCACADCGEIVYFSLHQIMFDHSKYCKKCGIKHIGDATRGDPVEIGWAKYYKDIKKRSIESFGEQCDMSKDEVIAMASQPCFYCGAEPRLHIDHNRYTVVRNGIDRVDSSHGYIKSNCVPCCITCNRMKLDLASDVWIAKMRQIIKRWDERSTTISQESTPKQAETDSDQAEEVTHPEETSFDVQPDLGF